MIEQDDYERRQIEDIGKVIAQRRYLTDMTQRELGRAAQIGQAAVTRFERGCDGFRIGTLQALARSLGYRIEITLVPIDGGDPVSGRPDPKLRSKRTFDGSLGRKYPNRKPAVRKPKPAAPVDPVPQVEYDSDDEFDIEKEMAATRARLGIN